MKTFLILLLSLKMLASPTQDIPKDIIRILNSGNGQSFETAFEVYTIDEEYKLLRFLKLTPIIQKLDIRDGVFYDTFKIDTKTIYFKLLSKSKLNIRKEPKINI